MSENFNNQVVDSNYLFDLLSIFGISAKSIKETSNRRFVTDTMMLSLGGVPSLTNAQMLALKPLGKTIVANTTNGAFYYWDGYEWKNLSSSLSSNSEEIQELLTEAVRKVAGYGLSKNDFTDAFKNMLNECYSWRHQRNKDTKLSEGSKSEVSAFEIRNHLDKHPAGLTDEQKADLFTIKDKVDKLVGSRLITTEEAQEILDTASLLENHIKFHPVTVISEGVTITALTAEQVLLLNEINNKVVKKAGFDLVSSTVMTDLIVDSHEKNKDDCLAFGTANYVTASEIRKFIDETTFNLFTEEDQILLQSINDKCDKPLEGMGFSENSFTNEEKALIVLLNTKMDDILSKPFALTTLQITAINSISDKVTKVEGRQLTEEVFTKEEKDFINLYMENGFPTSGDGGSSVSPLTPSQVSLLAALELRKDQLAAGYGLSERNFSAVLEEKLNSLTSSNVTANQIAAIETIKDKVDKVAGKSLSTNDFDATYKKNVDDLMIAKHDKDKDLSLAEGTVNYVTAKEIREHIDKPVGAGVVKWTPGIEIFNGQAVLCAGFLFEAVSTVSPDFKFTTKSTVELDIINQNLKPISTINNTRKWVPGKRVFNDEVIVGTDNKLYLVTAPAGIGKTCSMVDMKTDIDSSMLTIVGGGHDAGYDDRLAKGTANETLASDLRKHLDAASIIPGIPDWKPSTKYQNNQPLLDPITKIIYRVLAPVTPYYITTSSSMNTDITDGKIELISESALEELKSHILSVADGGNDYVNTTTKIGVTQVPYTIKITNNINDDNKNLVQVWKVQNSATDDVVTIVKDFDNADKSNFEGDIEGVVFDGSMYQKDTIELTPISTTPLGYGFVSEFEPIDGLEFVDSIVGIVAKKQ